MAAKPQIRESEALLPSNDYEPSQNAPQPALKVVTENLSLPGQPAAPVTQPPAQDPLQAVKAMSDEEKIALFS